MGERENKPMRIYLANRHEALILNDHVDSVAVSTSVDGTLVVGGNTYPITNGGAIPVIEPQNVAQIKAAFITADGVTYTVISPRVERGVLMSKPDPYSYILTQRIHIDKLEKSLEAATERIRKLEGLHTPKALNGIFFD